MEMKLSMKQSKLPILRHRKRFQLPEPPFPIPVASITNIPPTSTLWSYYTGCIDGLHVVIKHSGDKEWLYKMGFFGKGVFSRSQPIYDHQRPIFEDQFLPAVVTKHNFIRHSTWSNMVKLKGDGSSLLVDEEVNMQMHLNSCAENFSRPKLKNYESKNSSLQLSTSVVTSKRSAEPYNNLHKKVEFEAEDRTCIIDDEEDQPVSSQDCEEWADDTEGFWMCDTSSPNHHKHSEIEEQPFFAVPLRLHDDIPGIDKDMDKESNMVSKQIESRFLKPSDLCRCEKECQNLLSEPMMNSDYDDNKCSTVMDSQPVSHGCNVFQDKISENSDSNCDQKSQKRPCLSFHNIDDDNDGEILVQADSDDDISEGERSWKVKKDPFPLSECLHLMLEEAFFLSYGLGCLQIEDSNEDRLNLSQMWLKYSQLDSNFIPKYVVYHYLRSKGWVPKSGLKYGSEFVLYKKGPPFYHSSFSVRVQMVTENSYEIDPLSPNQILTWTSLSGFDRLTEHVAKDVLFCYVIRPSHVTDDCLLSPKCISEFKIREIMLKRWVPSQQRVGNAPKLS